MGSVLSMPVCVLSPAIRYLILSVSLFILFCPFLPFYLLDCYPGRGGVWSVARRVRRGEGYEGGESLTGIYCMKITTLH